MQRDDDRRLDSAVSLGIISAEQAGEIRALTPVREPLRRMTHTVGAETIGYVLGALTVLVAMGWFLADRWDWLGAGGVIAVSVLYAVLFLVVGWRLRAEGYPLAANCAVLLSVTMVPVAVVSVNEVMGWFALDNAAACSATDWRFWRCYGEELLVESLTVLALLAVLWRTRFALTVFPLAVLGMRFVFHVVTYIMHAQPGGAMAGWIFWIATCLTLAVAYETGRRQEGDEDFALWLHLVAAINASVTVSILITQVEWYRHFLIPAAFLAFVFSLRMRRFVWSLIGLGWFVSYLGWLAVDVFRDSPFFPIILAALGIGGIVATVWLQRNRERLVARFGRLESDGRPSFPGGSALMLLAIIVALVQLPSARFLDVQTRREWDAVRPQRPDSVRIETKASPQP
jgi:hypothetical protein